jgi:hypothetical protein
MRGPKHTVIALLALALSGGSPAVTDDKAAAKRIEAIDKLAFAVEEIDIVERAAAEGALDEAHKQYKSASKSFLDALTQLRKADPNEAEREQTEIYEDRFRELDPKGGELDAATVEKIVDLFHEAHEYFDPNVGD